MYVSCKRSLDCGLLSIHSLICSLHRFTDLLDHAELIPAVSGFSFWARSGDRERGESGGAKGPVSIMVEGKVSESFGPTLGEWRGDASQGKESRLRFLLSTLGLTEEPAGSIRYQLIHRAASSVITGEQFRAAAAVMLVHSFSEQRVGGPTTSRSRPFSGWTPLRVSFRGSVRAEGFRLRRVGCG